MLYGNIGLSNKFRIAIQAYDARGNIVWECELDIYGKVRNLHGEKTFIPFRFSGQYEDIETGLYYNRFRYYLLSFTRLPTNITTKYRCNTLQIPF
ncbi:hypothetical protein USCSP91_800001 [Tenacibaculum maritimum]|nr:hypothetical protein USCSP91_800001 [Tenacibaculum maritimum]